MSKFQVGDQVEILNTGNCYPGFTKWANFSGATNWVHERKPKLNEVATVIFTGKHMNAEANLLLLELANTEQYIFGNETGNSLKLVSSAYSKPKPLSSRLKKLGNAYRI